MHLDVRTNVHEHGSPDDLFNECAVYVDGVLVQHVIALDTIEGWVVAYKPGAGWDPGERVTHRGAVEHCRRDGFAQR